eukprot:TRINITY_DN147_c0_g1_i1.p1 TRINITY_DN147_c0_g1~~TRINITY_DN147_c0_g1_i1.p1  ORF type:complete len:135 (+),score=12.91 TRINITY_DN147_c0_g1_i1:119-523(+)
MGAVTARWTSFNTAFLEPNRTKAIATIAAQYSPTVQWTITSGVDPTAPTQKFIGSSSPEFTVLFNRLFSIAPITPKFTDKNSITVIDSKRAIYQYGNYPANGMKPIELIQVYAVKNKRGIWVSQSIVVFPFRSA